jgi:hypothetical protein
MFVKPRGLIVTMVVMPALAAFTLGIAGVWLTGELLVLPLVGLAALIAGGALVVYFTWRTTFQRWILHEADDERRATLKHSSGSGSGTRKRSSSVVWK